LTYTFPDLPDPILIESESLFVAISFHCIVTFPLVFWDIPFYILLEQCSSNYGFICFMVYFPLMVLYPPPGLTQGCLYVSILHNSFVWNFAKHLILNYCLFVHKTWLNNRRCGSRRFICVFQTQSEDLWPFFSWIRSRLFNTTDVWC